jgi:hypothetical protein
LPFNLFHGLMKLNSVNIMEKTIIILKTYVYVIWENLIQTIKMCSTTTCMCTTSFVTCLQLWEGWRVKLRGLLIIYICDYSWVEPIPDRFTFVRTAYIFIWQTNLWDINDINLLFLKIIGDSTSVDSHSEVYHPLSALRC